MKLTKTIRFLLLNIFILLPILFIAISSNAQIQIIQQKSAISILQPNKQLGNPNQQKQNNQNPEFYDTRSQFFSIPIKVANQFVNSLVELSSQMLNLNLAPSSQKFSLLQWTYSDLPSTRVESYFRKAHFGVWAKNSQSQDCYNVRAKALIRDNTGTLKFDTTNPCSVREGTWLDPYAGATINDALLVQIDHMVPLKEAYNSGAYKWTFKERCLYANYLGYNKHLISVDGEQNNDKGDKIPNDYLPPLKNYQCQYLKDWLFIKALWGLNMTPQESTFIKNKISELACNQNMFTISEEEIKKQYDFFKLNKDLCSGIEKMILDSKDKTKKDLSQKVP